MLPFMRSKNATKEYSITKFGGINKSFSQGINEFSDGYNMTSEFFPALSSVRGNEVFEKTQNVICGAGFYDKLYTLEQDENDPDNLHIMCDGDSLASFETEKEGKRKAEFMKDEFLVIPDNVIFHTDSSEISMGSFCQTINKENTLEKYMAENPSATNFPNPSLTWYSSHLAHNAIIAEQTKYSYSGQSYILYNFSLSGQFKPGDVITLKMNVAPLGDSTVSERQTYIHKMEKGLTLKIKDLTEITHYTASGNKITEIISIVFEDNSIDLDIFDEVLVMNVTIEKTMPDFNDICCFENRMWAVTDSEICASKLADCSQWENFTADQYGTLPSSSFRTGVESDGSFTAITAYNGNVMAFKEDCIHKIYGSEPAEYKLNRINCPGVKKGCRDTVAVAGGILFYMSKSGIYSYNGSSFKLISNPINIGEYEVVTANGDERYYRLVAKKGNETSVFVYDTRYGLWNKNLTENDICFLIQTDNGLVAVNEREKLKVNTGDYGNWSFTLSFGKKEFSSRHICSVFARYTLKESGNLKIQIRNKHDTYTIADTSAKANNFPLRITIPVSCARDSDLIFSGTGEFTLISLTVRYKETGIND